MGSQVLEMGSHRDAATLIGKSYLRMKKCAAAFALLKTCSQINAEAGILAYSLNTFSFPRYNNIVTFMALASEQEIRAIRVIRISYDVVLFISPTGLWSQLSCFHGLEEIRISFGGKKHNSTESNQAWLRTLLRLLRNHKPSVRVMTSNFIVGLSSVEYH